MHSTGVWGAYASGVAVGPDGSRVFVTGTIGTGPLANDCATVAYDASRGVALWRRLYENGTSNGCGSVATSPDGSRVFVGGTSDGNLAAIAYNAASGATLWQALLESASAYSLAVSPNGAAVYVTGLGTGAGSDTDYATVAYVA